MKFRSIFIILTIISTLCLSFLYYYKDYNKNTTDSKSQIIKKSVIQFVPFPTIISDSEGHRDNSLYDILISKSSKDISISDAEIKFDTSMVKLPFDLTGLLMRFSYDPVNNRVNFEGKNFFENSLTISGYYEVTSKNAINYDINIEDNFNSMKIQASYNPNESDNLNEGLIEGKFKFQSSNMFSFLDPKQALFANNFNSKKQSMIIEGDFEIKDNKLSSKKLRCHSDNLDATFNFDLIDENKLKMKVYIDYVDIDSIGAQINRANFSDFLTYEVIMDILNFDLDLEVKAKEVLYNKTKLNSFLLKVACGNNKDAKIDELSFKTSENTIFTTKGIVSKNQFRPLYKGEVNLQKITYNDFMNLFDLSRVNNFVNQGSDNNKTTISLDTKITLSPSLVVLENFQLYEGKTKLSSDFLKFSSYNINNSVLNGNVKIENLSDNVPFINLLMQNNFLSDAKNQQFLSIRRNHYNIVDGKVSFIGLNYGSKKIEDISFNYINHYHLLGIQNLVSSSKIFDLSGDFLINLIPQTPNLNATIRGDHVDIDLLNRIVMKHFFGYNLKSNDDDNNKTSYANNDFAVFRFNEFDGKIRVNVQDNNADSLQFIDCRISLEKEKTELKTCSFGLFGGKFRLENAIVNLRDNVSYEGKFQWENVDLQKFTNFANKAIFKSSGMKGTGRLNISGYQSSYGKNINDLIANADSKFNIKSAGLLKFDNFDITSLVRTYGYPIIRDKKTLIDANHKVAMYTNMHKGATLFKQFEADFVLDNGIVKSNNLRFITQDNIHGQTLFDYEILSDQMKGMMSIAYLKKSEKIDGFNISFNGKANNLKVSLGSG